MIDEAALSRDPTVRDRLAAVDEAVSGILVSRHRATCGATPTAGC